MITKIVNVIILQYAFSLNSTNNLNLQYILCMLTIRFSRKLDIRHDYIGF